MDAPIEVLHVDDDAEFADLVSTYLTREDERLQVRTATSAAAGFEHVEEVDCIVSDYDMPGETGVEFLERVREVAPDLPFILFTGKGSEAVAGDAISAGVTDYLQKGTGTDQYALLANKIRTAVEHNRRERERSRYEHMVDAMGEAACIYDAEGRFELVNAYLADYYGTTAADLVGTESQILPMIREMESGDPFQELLDGERTAYRTELSGRFRDGEYDVLDVQLTPLVVNGEVEAVVGVAREITEQKAREQALATGESRYRSLAEDVLDVLDSGLFILDSEFDVAWINSAAETYFGLDREAVLGRDKRELIREDIAAKFEDSETFTETVLATYDDNTYTEQFECHVLPGDGREERWLAHWSTPITEGTYRGGRVEHYQDVTDRIDRQQTLKAQNDRLEEFAAAVSHDLRNPLGVVEGRVALLAEETEHDSEHFAAIERALTRMNRIIDDVLWLAREGRDIGTTDAVVLGDAVREAWEMSVSADSPSTLVDTVDEGTAIVADRDRLHQLLENLLGNAVEHGGDGVEVRLERLPDGFAIEDDGVGIPASERPAIFELGYSNARDGTGFGLRIVERVAEAHGWTVRATEGDDGGARFEVTGVEFV